MESTIDLDAASAVFNAPVEIQENYLNTLKKSNRSLRQQRQNLQTINDLLQKQKREYNGNCL